MVCTHLVSLRTGAQDVVYMRDWHIKKGVCPASPKRKTQKATHKPAKSEVARIGHTPIQAILCSCKCETSWADEKQTIT